MSRRPDRLARLALHAYPRSFRHEYGDEMLRTLRDLTDHGGVRGPRLGLRIARDVALTAPRMRWEALMARSWLVASIVIVALGILAAAVGSPLLPLFLLCVVTLIAIVSRCHDRPIVADRAEAARWYRWVLVGLASFGAGFGVLAIEGNDELSSTGWSLWMLSWATGAVLVLFGLVLGASHLVHRRAA